MHFHSWSVTFWTLPCTDWQNKQHKIYDNSEDTSETGRRSYWQCVLVEDKTTSPQSKLPLIWYQTDLLGFQALSGQTFHMASWVTTAFVHHCIILSLNTNTHWFQIMMYLNSWSPAKRRVKPQESVQGPSKTNLSKQMQLVMEHSASTSNMISDH